MIITPPPGYFIHSPITGKYVNPNSATLLSSYPKIWHKIEHVKCHLNRYLQCSFELSVDMNNPRVLTTSDYLFFPDDPYNDPTYSVYETTTGSNVLNCRLYIESKAEKQIKKHGGKYVHSPKNVLEYAKSKCRNGYSFEDYLKDNNITEDQLIAYEDLQ